MDDVNKNKNNGEIDYVPEIVDIEGLQGINSSQGMEYFMKEDQWNNGGHNGKHEMNPPIGFPVYGGYDGNQSGTCPQVISCMASLCYMMSVHLTQMLQGGCAGSMTQPCQFGMQENGSTYNADEFHGYPPIY